MSSSCAVAADLMAAASTRSRRMVSSAILQIAGQRRVEEVIENAAHDGEVDDRPEQVGEAGFVRLGLHVGLRGVLGRLGRPALGARASRAATRADEHEPRRRTLCINSQAVDAACGHRALHQRFRRPQDARSENARDNGVGQVGGVTIERGSCVGRFLRHRCGGGLRVAFDCRFRVSARAARASRAPHDECRRWPRRRPPARHSAWCCTRPPRHAAFVDADSASSRAPRTAAVRCSITFRIGWKISVFRRKVQSSRKKTTQRVEISGIMAND